MDIKEFGTYIQSLIAGRNLDEQTAYALFCDVLNNQQPDLQQGAFLAALVAKGETVDELFAAWRAIDEIDTVHVTPKVAGHLYENSGTGMDGLNTINVSTAAALIAAAGGVAMARHGARALSSKCGTVDMAEALGIDVECDADTVADSIKQCGIGLFNGMNPAIHPAALGRILSQIRFGSTLNIAASLAHPARPSRAVRGVYHPDLTHKVAHVMQRIGYEKAMVICGIDAASGRFMDEFSPCGTTHITTLSGGVMRSFTLEPEEAEIDRCKLTDLLWQGPLTSERDRFVALLEGRAEKPMADFACLNAAGIFVLADMVPDLKSGVALSRSILASGAAMETLDAWRKAQQCPAKKQ